MNTSSDNLQATYVIEVTFDKGRKIWTEPLSA